MESINNCNTTGLNIDTNNCDAPIMDYSWYSGSAEQNDNSVDTEQCFYDGVNIQTVTDDNDNGNDDNNDNNNSPFCTQSFSTGPNACENTLTFTFGHPDPVTSTTPETDADPETNNESDNGDGDDGNGNNNTRYRAETNRLISIIVESLNTANNLIGPCNAVGGNTNTNTDGDSISNPSGESPCLSTYSAPSFITGNSETNCPYLNRYAMRSRRYPCYVKCVINRSSFITRTRGGISARVEVIEPSTLYVRKGTDMATVNVKNRTVMTIGNGDCISNTDVPARPNYILASGSKVIGVDLMPYVISQDVCVTLQPGSASFYVPGGTGFMVGGTNVNLTYPTLFESI